MKPTKIILRYWFALTSVLSFVGGWIILAHSPKPINPNSGSSSSLAPLPTLPPIQSFGSQNNNNNGFGIFSSPQSNSQQNFGIPMMRTGGS